jgi:hypothetical protein
MTGVATRHSTVALSTVAFVSMARSTVATMFCAVVGHPAVTSTPMMSHAAMRHPAVAMTTMAFSAAAMMTRVAMRHSTMTAAAVVTYVAARHLAMTHATMRPSTMTHSTMRPSTAAHATLTSTLTTVHRCETGVPVMTVMPAETTTHVATHCTAVTEAGKHAALAAVAAPVTFERHVHAMAVSTEAAMTEMTVPEGHCTKALMSVALMAMLAMVAVLRDSLFCVFSRHRAVMCFTLRRAVMSMAGPDRRAMFPLAMSFFAVFFITMLVVSPRVNFFVLFLHDDLLVAFVFLLLAMLLVFFFSFVPLVPFV